MKRKEIQQSAKEQIELARDVENLLSSKGWAIYRAYRARKIQEIKNKNDYLNIYDFRADRKAIKVILEIEAELRDAVSDAVEAQEIINKLNQTSESMVIPLDEETEE